MADATVFISFEKVMNGGYHAIFIIFGMAYVFSKALFNILDISLKGQRLNYVMPSENLRKTFLLILFLTEIPRPRCSLALS